MSAGIVTGFERAVLFRIARFVALVICTALFVSLVAGILYLVFGGGAENKLPSGHEYMEQQRSGQQIQQPSTDPVTRMVQKASGQNPDTVDTPTTLKIPASMQEKFSTPEAQKGLENALSVLPADQRQPCLDGLGEVVQDASSKNMDVPKATEGYFSTCKAHATNLELQRAAEVKAKFIIAGSIVSTLILLATFSLVLVLMAIERNTRPDARESKR